MNKSINYTLGLCTMGNSAAALFRDGVLIAAVEEERLTRIKNDGRFPYNAIKEVLSIEKIKAYIQNLPLAQYNVPMTKLTIHK